MRTFTIPLVLASLLVVAAWSARTTNPLLSDRFIDEINKKAGTWKAGQNFHHKTSIKYLRRLLGALPHEEDVSLERKVHPLHLLKDLPNEFDARTAWPECPIINEIRDQGSCGSCWAISSAEVMSDRTCIQTNGQVDFRYSTEDIMSCCFPTCGLGCDGGWPQLAFKYWLQIGVVSGGPYNSSQGCMPYEIAPCEHHIDGERPSCDSMDPETPECQHKCKLGYNADYFDDKHKGNEVYLLIPDENNIMYDIMTHGPVVATFAVFEDFFSYKSGVYCHVSGYYLGDHAIKILGWGVENDVKYWLCANSWNTDWGDNGYFKILRGENECAIEDNIIGGNI